MSPLNLLPFNDTCRRPGDAAKRLTPGFKFGRLAPLSVAAALALLVGVVGCGGGGDASTTPATPADTTPTATASNFTQGTITGFGSVIVNGVRFDDSSATVTDDLGLKTTLSALHLGMRVDVDSSAVDAATATAKAAAFRFGGQVLGPVSALNTAANTLTVLGQVVDIASSTVFDSSLSGGLSAVLVGAVIEVHGTLDAATGHITATRIERKTAATAYKLRGTVAALDTTLKTFTLGGVLISYASVDSSLVPSTLANGVTLTAVLATTQSKGTWVAQSFGVKPTKPLDHTTAQLRGAITAFTSATSFTVDGLVVDATNATFPDGSTGLALGVAVEVKGTVTNGVLVATSVSLESHHQGDDSHKMQLFGAITAVDATAMTFVVRDTTATYGSATVYVNGTVADLLVGRKVHVKGGVGSTRTQVLATEVSFDH